MSRSPAALNNLVRDDVKLSSSLRQSSPRKAANTPQKRRGMKSPLSPKGMVSVFNPNSSMNTSSRFKASPSPPLATANASTFPASPSAGSLTSSYWSPVPGSRQQHSPQRLPAVDVRQTPPNAYFTGAQGRNDMGPQSPTKTALPWLAGKGSPSSQSVPSYPLPKKVHRVQQPNQDSKGAILAAAASNQLMAASFLSQLEPYRTFHPLVVSTGAHHNATSASPSLWDAVNRLMDSQSGSSGATNPNISRLMQPTRAHGGAAIEESSPSMPTAASGMVMVPNGSTNMEFSELNDGSQLRKPMRVRPPVRDRSMRSQGSNTLVDLQSRSTVGGDQSGALVTEQDLEKLVRHSQDALSLRIWRGANPNESMESVRNRARVLNEKRTEQERLERLQYMKRWKQELDPLLSMPVDDMSVTSSSVPLPLDPGITSDILLSIKDESTEYATTEQQASWFAFHTTEEQNELLMARSGRKNSILQRKSAAQSVTQMQFSMTNRRSVRNANDSFIAGKSDVSIAGPDLGDGVSTPRKTIAKRIESERRNQLGKWLGGQWKLHNYRHEEAAVRIQCMYRCFKARQQLRRCRQLRFTLLVAEIETEKEVVASWSVAVRVMDDERFAVGDRNASDEVNAALAAIRFFVSKINAKVQLRRAAHQKGLEQLKELQEFAALTIQRFYRGHCGRREARERRCPELYQQRMAVRYALAATSIQRIWKGYAARKRIILCWQNCIIIQRHFRVYAARAALKRYLQAERRRLVFETEDFAARIIQRTLRVYAMRRRILVSKHLDAFTQLVRAVRGYRVRQRLHIILLRHIRTARSRHSSIASPSIARSIKAGSMLTTQNNVDFSEALQDTAARHAAAQLLIRNQSNASAADHTL